MNIDIIKIYRKYGVHFKTSGHKHCRPGWVQTPCPYCTGNPGYHLGFCVEGKYAGTFVCWRCGGKSLRKTLAKLLRLSPYEINTLLKDSKGNTYLDYKKDRKKTPKKEFTYPARTLPLMPHHARYLKKRGFNPEYLVRKYGLKSTGPMAPLVIGEKILDYSHRIIIPILWNGEVVSFQGRDITNRHKLKYMGCPEEIETIPHKSILYGDAPGKRAILVEGVTDVWKLGRGALCTFGVKFTPSQLKILARTYEELITLYDPDEAGKQQAEKIRIEMGMRGIPVHNETCGNTDPGAMPRKEAKKLMKHLTTKRI